jgi:hypothetical protein
MAQESSRQKVYDCVPLRAGVCGATVSQKAALSLRKKIDVVPRRLWAEVLALRPAELILLSRMAAANKAGTDWFLNVSG